MKNLLFLLCCLLCTPLVAQTKTQIVSGIETDNAYSFKVKFDSSHNDELLAAYYAVINADAEKPFKPLKIVGTATTTTPSGTTIELNTKRSSLKIRSAKSNAASRAEAERYANIARTELGLEVPEPPTPPTPPGGGQ